MSIAAKNSKTAGGLAHRLLCHSVCSYLEFMGMVSHGNERSIIIPLHFPDSFRAAGILCPNLTEARALEVIFYKLCKRWSGRKARPLRQAIVKIIENLPRKEIKAVLRFRICFHCGLYQLQHQELLTHRKNFTCFFPEIEELLSRVTHRNQCFSPNLYGRNSPERLVGSVFIAILQVVT